MRLHFIQMSVYAARLDCTASYVPSIHAGPAAALPLCPVLQVVQKRTNVPGLKAGRGRGRGRGGGYPGYAPYPAYPAPYYGGGRGGYYPPPRGRGFGGPPGYVLGTGCWAGVGKAPRRRRSGQEYLGGGGDEGGPVGWCKGVQCVAGLVQPGQPVVIAAAQLHMGEWPWTRWDMLGSEWGAVARSLLALPLEPKPDMSTATPRPSSVRRPA